MAVPVTGRHYFRRRISDHCSKTVVAFLLIAGSGLILTGCEGTVINKKSRWYLEYKSFFFLRAGKKLKYAGVDKIYINSSRTTQRLNTAYTNHSSTFSNIEFNGFLKFTGGEKIKLTSKRNKTEVLKCLQPISRFLNATIEDNTAAAS